jgi:hypothetical protein
VEGVVGALTKSFLIFMVLSGVEESSIRGSSRLGVMLLVRCPCSIGIIRVSCGNGLIKGPVVPSIIVSSALVIIIIFFFFLQGSGTLPWVPQSSMVLGLPTVVASICRSF